MPKSAVARAQVSEPSRVKFTTQYHELEFADVGAGVAVMTPEWDGIALVLTKEDVARLGALCSVVSARP